MRALLSSIMIFSTFLCSVSASAATSRTYAPATLLSVQQQNKDEPWVAGSPSDAPLRVESYTYLFTLRQGCTDYVASYDSYSSKFAKLFRVNTPVQVSVSKHLLYLHADWNDDDEDLRMSLVNKHAIAGCSATQGQ